jgi:hypothetical protein
MTPSLRVLGIPAAAAIALAPLSALNSPVAHACQPGFSMQNLSPLLGPMCAPDPNAQNGVSPNGTANVPVCSNSQYCGNIPQQVAQLPPPEPPGGMPPVMQGTIDPNTGKYTPGIPNYTEPWKPVPPGGEPDPWGTGASTNTSCAGFGATCPG